MYLVFEGEVGIYVKDIFTSLKQVATLRENKVFGERSLETEDKRAATVKALEPTTCLVLYKRDFNEIIYVGIPIDCSTSK